ncbi:MAG TPA: anthranilate synthase component I family protein [Aquifex aeolicus]|nr:anthranilate synthase component I family protein [Aquifex aeolicus]
MELLISGSWLNESGIFKASVEDIKFFDSIEELPELKATYFVILSYSLSNETLEVNIKKGNEPQIILLKIKKFEKYNPSYCKSVFLSLDKPVLSDKEYEKRIEIIKNFIRKGDVYQINLTNRFDFFLDGNPKELFLNFYRFQPVPFAFYLNLKDFYIISGSMELFLEKKGETLKSKPIKGTSRVKSELLESEKEKAENLMITDMMRNDISKIAEIGSVKVEKLFDIEEFRTLYHMVSTVVGRTKKDFKNIVKNTFPPASVTGAPKKRAVEIIDLLEPFPRTYYCGSGGLIFPNGDFKLSVLIRTAIGKKEKLSYYAGCGIVWDSIPKKEVEEMHLKGEAFKRAGTGNLIFKR